VRSAPENARRGRLRITEQGELINELYGLRPIALRVFEQAFNALTLSDAGVLPPEDVEPEWRSAMDVIAEEGRRAYAALVYENPLFMDFFRQVTPIDVIERMQLGSRPTTRDENGGIAALRAIPWTQAWAQCRYMLPGWMGAGSALEFASTQLGEQVLQDMYARWFFFQNLVDDVELSLARADLGIAAFYEELVDAKCKPLIETIHAEYERAKNCVLKLKGCVRLLDGEPTVQRSIRLRLPYIDPMHLVQVDLLRRWRADGREDRQMLNALLATVSGITQGLQGS
jgi:phosphoenolpyruvate carboxylase